ncbi:MAG: hypothetical protein R2788_02320 [Saprospiraceae bacterium]
MCSSALSPEVTAPTYGHQRTWTATDADTTVQVFTFADTTPPVCHHLPTGSGHRGCGLGDIAGNGRRFLDSGGGIRLSS